MEIVIIIFMVIMSIFALSCLTYVTADIIIEQINKKKQPAVAVVAPVVVEKEPEPAPVVVPVVEEMPEIVEHIDAAEADTMISDDLAIKKSRFEKGAGHGKQGIVNIGDIDKVFEANAVVTMAKLKEVGLIPKNVARIKVLAAGVLNKPLTIKAEHYSIPAMKMIELTGGTVIILKD